MTTAQQLSDEAAVRGVINKLEDVHQANMKRNAFAAWAVEDLLEQHIEKKGSKKGFFTRHFSRRRNSKAKADKRKAALNLEEEEPVEETDRDSINPFSTVEGCELQTDEQGQQQKSVRQDHAKEEDGAKGKKNQRGGRSFRLGLGLRKKSWSGMGKDNAKNETDGETETETETETKDEIDDGTKDGNEEGAEPAKKGPVGSLRTKLKARSHRKLKAKVDKKVAAAMARAESEREKWGRTNDAETKRAHGEKLSRRERQLLKQQGRAVKKATAEEEQLKLAKAKRHKEFLEKAATRSKELMLSHLCAIAIQSAWRGASAREALRLAEEYHNRAFTSATPPSATNHSSGGGGSGVVQLRRPSQPSDFLSPTTQIAVDCHAADMANEDSDADAEVEAGKGKADTLQTQMQTQKKSLISPSLMQMVEANHQAVMSP